MKFNEKDTDMSERELKFVSGMLKFSLYAAFACMCIGAALNIFKPARGIANIFIRSAVYLGVIGFTMLMHMQGKSGIGLVYALAQLFSAVFFVIGIIFSIKDGWDRLTGLYTLIGGIAFLLLFLFKPKYLKNE